MSADQACTGNRTMTVTLAYFEKEGTGMPATFTCDLPAHTTNDWVLKHLNSDDGLTVTAHGTGPQVLSKQHVRLYRGEKRMDELHDGDTLDLVIVD